MAAKSTSYQFPGHEGQPYELHTTLSPNHIQQVSNSSRFVFRENHMLYQNTYYFFAGWLGIQKTSKKQQLSCFDVFKCTFLSST